MLGHFQLMLWFSAWTTRHWGSCSRSPRQVIPYDTLPSPVTLETVCLPSVTRSRPQLQGDRSHTWFVPVFPLLAFDRAHPLLGEGMKSSESDMTASCIRLDHVSVQQNVVGFDLQKLQLPVTEAFPSSPFFVDSHHWVTIRFLAE